MEGGYFPAKLKRKDLDEVNDDFFDFSLSSPARKIRRLDAELPRILEEEEMVNPVVVESSPIDIDKLSGSLPENEERAIILYDPMNNMPSVQSRSPFSISVNSDFLSGYKNRALWSNHSHLHKSLDGKTEKQEDDSLKNNGTLAVVPWVPPHSQHITMPQMDVSHTQEVCEMMDADDEMDDITMDIEDNNNNFQQIPKKEFGSNVNQWQQQHCMIRQQPHNLSTQIAWSHTSVDS